MTRLKLPSLPTRPYRPPAPSPPLPLPVSFVRTKMFGGKGTKSPAEDEEVSINLHRADAKPEAVADGVFGVQEEGAPSA